MPERSSTSGPDSATAADAVSVRALGIAGAVIATGMVASVAAAFLLLHAYTHDNAGATAPAPGPPPRIANPVRLQPDPVQDVAAYRAQKQALLTTYAWIDRAHGVVRIPIERAMAILAAPPAGAAR